MDTKSYSFEPKDYVTDEEYEYAVTSRPIISMVANVTDACNFKCRYCFTHPNPRVMSLETGKKLINMLIEQSVKWKGSGSFSPQFYFFGGEPMLRYEEFIKPIILWAEEKGYVKNNNLQFGMTSNGSLFNEERCKFLSDHDCTLLLSIDGDAPTQDSQRPTCSGVSSSSVVFKNIPLILKYWPEVTFRSTIEPYNADKLLDNYLFARKEGFRNYFVCPNAFSEDWTENVIETVLGQLALIESVFFRDLVNGNTILRWSEIDREILRIFLGDIDQNAHVHPMERLFRCGLGTTSLGVSPNGDFFGCQEHNTYGAENPEDIFLIGNIDTGIDKERHLKLLNSYVKSLNGRHSIDRNDRCKICSFKGRCSGVSCLSREFDFGDIGNRPTINCVWHDFLRRSVRLLVPEFLKTPEYKKQFEKYLMELVDGPLGGKW